MQPTCTERHTCADPYIPISTSSHNYTPMQSANTCVNTHTTHHLNAYTLVYPRSNKHVPHLLNSMDHANAFPPLTHAMTATGAQRYLQYTSVYGPYTVPIQKPCTPTHTITHTTSPSSKKLSQPADMYCTTPRCTLTPISTHIHKEGTS